MSTAKATMKTCSSCGKEKPVSDFYGNRGTKDGLIGKCKFCISVKNSNEREIISRNVRAEALADVIQAAGVSAASMTNAKDEAWGATSDVASRLIPQFKAPYMPSEETRVLVLAKLTRREMLAQELRRKK